LKTLEEPPPHVYFIFATTDPRKVLPTVLSRCQRFDFRRISGDSIIEHLSMIVEKSDYGVEKEALALIARRVDGSLRDAESLLDQVVAFGGKGLNAKKAAELLGIVEQDVYFELLDIIANQDTSRGLGLVDQIFHQGHDFEEVILGILEHLRHLLVVKATNDAGELLANAALDVDRYQKQADRFDTEDLLRLSQLATQMEQDLRFSALPRVQLETGVVRMIRMTPSVLLSDVLIRLNELASDLDSTMDAVNPSKPSVQPVPASTQASEQSANTRITRAKSTSAPKTSPSARTSGKATTQKKPLTQAAD